MPTSFLSFLFVILLTPQWYLTNIYFYQSSFIFLLTKNSQVIRWGKGGRLWAEFSLAIIWLLPLTTCWAALQAPEAKTSKSPRIHHTLIFFSSPLLPGTMQPFWRTQSKRSIGNQLARYSPLQRDQTTHLASGHQARVSLNSCSFPW